MSNNDEFLDDEVAGAGTEAGAVAPWVMMIVDDEPDIHTVTKLALKNVTYLGRALDLVSCHTADEAMKTLAARDDVAVVLLDVVMESDQAGLDCVRRIREELGNTEVRLVLRTGQPGAAPEREVILAYDINDYKAKTDLTADKLYTTVIAALRGYADVCELNKYRQDALIALNDQLGLLGAVVDVVPLPLVHVDPLGLITACNAAFADLAQTTPGEIVGEFARDVLPESLSDVLVLPESGQDFGTCTVDMGGPRRFTVIRRAHRIPDAVADDLICLLKPLAAE